MSNETNNWVKKVAAANGVTKEEVLKYIKSLSSDAKVIHHLNLA